MSEWEVIEKTLKRTARRRRADRIWRGFWMGLFCAAIVLVLGLGAYKLFPIPKEALFGGIALAGLLLLGATFRGVFSKATLLDTARWVDSRHGLKERLSTAWEMARGTGDEGWKQLVTSDAARHAASVDPKSTLPLRLPILGRWALVIVALAAGLGFVPEYRSRAYVQKQQNIGHVRETGKQLAELTRRNLQERPPVLEPTQKSLESIAELGEKLSKANLTRGEALRDLASAVQKLESEAKSLTDNPALKRMEQAARENGGATGTQGGEGQQKQMQTLQEKLGQAANNPGALDKAKESLLKAQQAMANLGNKDAAQAQAAREQLTQSLGELAQQMRDMGQPMPDIDEAIRALENNQTDLAVKNMQLAMNDLDKLRDMAKALAQMQKEGGGIGKDLPEQLKNGQTQAAQKRLEEMQQQLKPAQLSREQLQKMTDELSRSVDPGSQYGKVGDLLREAASSAQSGQKQQAGEALAQAAKELDKLNQQLADAQAMMAGLDALERAQMALMTGKKWEECQAGACKACHGAGCAKCQGRGWSHGGKPGSGVGTWADETGWMSVPDESRHVGMDNSGITRPDMDARGVADRDANLNPNLLPTKVRGQISQGGPMPSITLKGVSIKGQSKVEYEEAAAAAQTDAQSALNQDKVPRAYQNAVRDYFDDFKK